MAGGAGWAGAPAALLRSVRRLREVFEVCGRDPDGFLRVERVAALGLRFGQGEEVRSSRARPHAGGTAGTPCCHTPGLCVTWHARGDRPVHLPFPPGHPQSEELLNLASGHPLAYKSSRRGMCAPHQA